MLHERGDGEMLIVLTVTDEVRHLTNAIVVKQIAQLVHQVSRNVAVALLNKIVPHELDSLVSETVGGAGRSPSPSS